MEPTSFCLTHLPLGGCAATSLGHLTLYIWMSWQKFIYGDGFLINLFECQTLNAISVPSSEYVFNSISTTMSDPICLYYFSFSWKSTFEFKCIPSTFWICVKHFRYNLFDVEQDFMFLNQTDKNVEACKNKLSIYLILKSQNFYVFFLWSILI